MKKGLYFTFTAFLAVSMLILVGCPDKIEDDDPINPALVGDWSNNAPEEKDVRTFTIKNDGSFSATLNPGGTQGQGTVTGKLVKEENSYLMSGMKETTGASWGGTVTLYNDPVQITFSNDNNTFTLTSDNVAIRLFFGGDYHRQ